MTVVALSEYDLKRNNSLRSNIFFFGGGGLKTKSSQCYLTTEIERTFSHPNKAQLSKTLNFSLSFSLLCFINTVVKKLPVCHHLKTKGSSRSKEPTDGC